MSKYVSVGLIGLLALAGIVGCANPADDKPQAEVGQAIADDGSSGQGDRFKLSAATKIGFIGSKVTGSHDGGFNAFDGEITLADGNPTSGRVHVMIDTTSPSLNTLVRSVSAPPMVAATAALRSPEPMEAARSRAVEPCGSSRFVPSGSEMVMFDMNGSG